MEVMSKTFFFSVEPVLYHITFWYTVLSFHNVITLLELALDSVNNNPQEVISRLVRVEMFYI